MRAPAADSTSAHDEPRQVFGMPNTAPGRKSGQRASRAKADYRRLLGVIRPLERRLLHGPTHGTFLLEAPNGFSGKVSAETAGILAMLYAVSELSFQYPTQDHCATRFHHCRGRTHWIVRRPRRSSRRSTDASHGDRGGDGLCRRSHSRSRL
jgi:hypothetical protein